MKSRRGSRIAGWENEMNAKGEFPGEDGRLTAILAALRKYFDRIRKYFLRTAIFYGVLITAFLILVLTAKDSKDRGGISGDPHPRFVGVPGDVDIGVEWVEGHRAHLWQVLKSLSLTPGDTARGAGGCGKVG